MGTSTARDWITDCGSHDPRRPQLGVCRPRSHSERPVALAPTSFPPPELDVHEDTSVRAINPYARSSAVSDDSEHFQSVSDLPEPMRAPQTDAPPARKPTEKTTDSMLSRYFREMASHNVMGPDDEVHAAKQVETAEIAYWIAILSYLPAAEHALDSLENDVAQLTDTTEPVDLSDIDPLRKLIEIYKQNGKLTAAQERRYRHHSGRLAKAVRLPDSDRIWVSRCEQVVRQLIHPCENPDVATNTTVLPDCPAYQQYLERISTAFDRQMQAKCVFVKANLRLVVSIARRYNRGRMPLIDLIQEGNIGLMKAVERYDHRRGYRFSTYASWWIRHAISRALADKGRAVRIPVHMLDTHNRVMRATQAITARTGRTPTRKELARETGIPLEKLDKVKEFYTETPFSLDRPVGDEDGRMFIDFLQDDEANTPYDDLASRKWADEVRRLLTMLTPIESRIIRWRFGLDDETELTLKEIGDKYNLSRERIRQLQEQALGKIRKQMREF